MQKYCFTPSLLLLIFLYKNIVCGLSAQIQRVGIMVKHRGKLFATAVPCCGETKYTTIQTRYPTYVENESSQKASASY